jgi:DNA repair protein RecN (Recombination protein N)
MDERERAARIELLSFQLAELQKAQLRAGEDVDLDTSRRVLMNAEKLQRWSAEAYEVLYEREGAAVSQLALVWKRVAELAGVDPQFQPFLDGRDAIKAQLDELASALRGYREGVDAAPERLQEVEDRLALIERLKRKHGATLDTLITRKDEYARQLHGLQHVDDRRADLARELERARGEFATRARELSRRRREAARLFTTRLQRLLEELAMGKTSLEMRFAPELDETAWSESGVDSAECYLSANVGEELRPLARIASGGELSRVMLAIRTLAAADAPGKTLIFDEIDAGIGGRVADVVGRKLRELGDTFQVLCITHLPQIAAAGHAHFQLSKHVSGGRTRTRVTRLEGADRVDEVARMIGGAALTEASRAAARELLRACQGESESRLKAKAKGPRS